MDASSAHPTSPPLPAGTTESNDVRAMVPRAWLVASIALNVAALAIVVPPVFEGSVLTRERFEIRADDGQLAGVFQATDTGAELVIGDRDEAARLWVDGDGAWLRFGREATPTLTIGVAATHGSVVLDTGDHRVELAVGADRATLAVQGKDADLALTADTSGARLKLVDRHRYGFEEAPDAPRTVEVSADPKSTAIAVAADGRTVRYAVDDGATSIDMKGPDGRVLLEGTPRPRITMESPAGRFVLGADARHPSSLARWEHDGTLDVWPPVHDHAPLREGTEGGR